MNRVLYLWSLDAEQSIRDKLELQLSAIASDNRLEIQHENRLMAGDLRMESMDFVGRATVIVALLSPELLATRGKEIARAMLRRSRGEVIVIPVLARDVARQNAHEQSIFSLVVVPKNPPIARWLDQDEACAFVANEIRKTIENKLPPIMMSQEPAPQYENEAFQVLGAALEGLMRELEKTQQREENLLNQYRELQKKFRAEGRLMAGDVLSHRYRLLARAHSDEHVTVWDGWDAQTQRIVMVHELSQLVASSGELRERCFARIRQLAAAPHRAVLGVVCAEAQDGIHDYFVTELLERKLAAVGHQREFSDNGVISLGLLLGEGVEALHRAGIIHGAVRPDNIFCAADGHHKVGCIDALLGTDVRGSATAGIDIWGTAYTAPELIGKGAIQADVRADVYGLAITLASLFYGADLGRRPREQVPALVDGLRCGVRVRNVLRQAISDDPLGRPNTAEELCNELVVAQRMHREHASELPAARRATVLDMVSVAGGQFEMGGGEGARPHELPTRKVSVSAFEIGKYPVTVGQFAEIMALADKPKPGCADLPMTEVSFHDAAQLCNRLSALEGLTPAYGLRDGEIRWNREADGYRLPLEAEWELAARGTDGRTFAWGEDPPAWQLCWNGRRPSANGRPERLPNNQVMPEPVTRHPEGVSANGVHDMQGNVWEWCWDWFEKYKPARATLHDPSGPDAPEHPPEAPGPGAYRVVRGGSWRVSDPTRVRAAARAFDDEIVRQVDIGFRVARGAKPNAASTSGNPAPEPQSAESGQGSDTL